MVMPRSSSKEQRDDADLNDNELVVAGLVADGLSNREAAARHFMSRHTVDFHLRQIYQKLGIHSRLELARIVIEHGASAT